MADKISEKTKIKGSINPWNRMTEYDGAAQGQHWPAGCLDLSQEFYTNHSSPLSGLEAYSCIYCANNMHRSHQCDLISRH